MGSLLPMLATFPAVHPFAAFQQQYETVPIYGTLRMMVSKTFSGTLGSTTASGSEFEIFELTYSGFDEDRNQIMTLRAAGQGEMTSKSPLAAAHCQGKLSWARTFHPPSGMEVNRAEHRYRFRPYLEPTPMGEVDCRATQKGAPPTVRHDTRVIDVDIPSNIDGQPIKGPDALNAIFHNVGPVYENGTIAGAWNGTSASGSYALDVPSRMPRSWISGGTAILVGALEVTHTMVYWHLSLKPIEPCIAKITFASRGDIKVDGEPAYETIAVEGQPRRAYKDLQEGQTIETGDRTRVEVTLSDGSNIRIGPNSKVNLGSVLCGKAEDRKVSMKLRIGNIYANFTHHVTGDVVFEDVKIITGGGVRDSKMEASVEANGVVTMRVDEGHGFFWGGRGPSKKEVNLEAGFCSSVKPGEPPSAPYLCKPFFTWEE